VSQRSWGTILVEPSGQRGCPFEELTGNKTCQTRNKRREDLDWNDTSQFVGACGMNRNELVEDAHVPKLNHQDEGGHAHQALTDVKICHNDEIFHL
jgi:hypothetical protein